MSIYLLLWADACHSLLAWGDWYDAGG